MISLTAVTWDRPRPPDMFGVAIRSTYARADAATVVRGTGGITDVMWVPDLARSGWWSLSRADELLASLGWARFVQWARPVPELYGPLGPYWEVPVCRVADLTT